MKEAMDRVLLGIRGYLEDNLIYRADLEGIDQGLAAVTDPVRAREAIAALRAVNQRMESKSARLSDELEAAQREIASLRETVDEVERLALLDALTQVGNRRFFDRHIKADMAACRASGAHLCLAFADIDRFKVVNDKFGHVVGDHLLKSFAEMLTGGVKGRGKVVRYGGEEFALLFPGVPFPEARRIVENLRRDLEAKRWVVGPNELPLGVITASFGLAKLAPGESAESFVHRADSRMMRAKSLGRNRVVADDGAVAAPAVAARG
jgi:diguanylate cyclase